MAETGDTGGDTTALENALGGMFDTPPKPQKVAVEPIPDTPEGDLAEAEAAISAEPTEEEVKAEAAAIPELEMEVEVDGVKEIVKGEAQVKELVQKGLHYSKNSEQNARVRDALVAQGKALQDAAGFQQAIVGDMAQLQAIDQRLEEFNKIDWATAIDSDFVGVMKLQEQRAQLREQRQKVLGEINQKQQYHQQSQAKAAQEMLVAESAALVAKLPAWRNSETAKAEQASIVSALTSHYGFNQAEVGQIMDHRMVMVARDAMKYRALQVAKQDQTKQVRDAPPVSKPGSAPQTNSKSDFTKFRQENRKLGQQGKSHAQTALLEKALGRVFK